jgi:POT family proton-dependent oligopeptide transporter
MAAEIPTTWFQAFNPFMIFAFTPAIVALWRHQAEKGREPSTVIKMALGCFGQALAYLLLAYAAWHTSVVGKASWLWLFAFFVVLTVAELYLSPVGLSLVSKIAPVRLLSMLMGFWLATSFTGNLMAGWLGTFWTSFDTPRFFLLIGAISGAAGLATLACAPFVRPLLRE